MRIKQKLAAMLAVLLILIQGLPVLASPLSQEEPETTTIEEDSGILPLPEVSQPSDMQEPSDVQPPVDIQPPSDIQPPELPILETVDESENLIFSANLLDNAEVPGVYGTLNYIPEDTRQITVLYSFDGEDFHTTINSDEDGDRKWDLSGFLEEGRSPELTQLCVGINDYPFKAYQSLEESFRRGCVRTSTRYVAYRGTDFTKRHQLGYYLRDCKLRCDMEGST